MRCVAGEFGKQILRGFGPRVKAVLAGTPVIEQPCGQGIDLAVPAHERLVNELAVTAKTQGVIRTETQGLILPTPRDLPPERGQRFRIRPMNCGAVDCRIPRPVGIEYIRPLWRLA